MTLNIPLPKIEVSALFEVTHKPGAVRLDAFPLLVYAPAQHGPGVRTEDVGASVAEIGAAAAETPDHGALAARFGTTPDHVAQALNYCVEALRAGGVV